MNYKVRGGGLGAEPTTKMEIAESSIYRFLLNFNEEFCAAFRICSGFESREQVGISYWGV